MGRPRLPDDVRRADLISIRLTHSELEELEAWASLKGEPLAPLVRKTALRAARRSR